jgi:hypothetical protein
VKWRDLTGFKAASIASVSGIASLIAALFELRQIISVLAGEFSGIESLGGLVKAIAYRSDIEFFGLVTTALLVVGSVGILMKGISSLVQSMLRWERAKVTTKTKISVNTPKGRKEVDVDLADSSAVLKTLREQSGRKRPGIRQR